MSGKEDIAVSPEPPANHEGTTTQTPPAADGVCAEQIILNAWNKVTQQNHRAPHFLKMIRDRVEEGLVPASFTPSHHESFIRFNLLQPWWEGTPSPAVLYGSRTAFENAWERAYAKSRQLYEKGEDGEEWDAEKCAYVNNSPIVECIHCDGSYMETYGEDGLCPDCAEQIRERKRETEEVAA